MKNEYEMKIAGLSRKLPLCPISDELMIGAFIMFGDVEITKAAAEALLRRAPEFDIMITAECKGIPLIYEMARQNGSDNYIVARKGSKLYMKNVLKIDVQSITTKGVQTLFIGEDEVNALRGKKVLIVDDVISTGESLKAIEELVKAAGGEVVCKMAVLAEGSAADREDIVFLERLPLFNKDGEPL